MSDSVIEFLHAMKRHDLSTALTLERLELVRQLCDSQAEVERLRAELAQERTNHDETAPDMVKLVFRKSSIKDAGPIHREGCDDE